MTEKPVNTINTIEGLTELARIVRRARGNQSLRAFAQEVGIDPMTIRRLEKGLTQNPEDTTFIALARVCGFSFEELKAIASSRTPDQSGNRERARNQLLALSDADATALIIERVAGMQGVEGLAEILRAVADRLSTRS